MSESVPMFDPHSTDGSPDSARPSDRVPAVDAEQRFASCRWRKPADGGLPGHCIHREVLPMAGIHGFSADSWCPECRYYKLRRIPRKDTFKEPVTNR